MRRDDSLRGEKLVKKESSARKLGDARGEKNGAKGGQRGSGFSRFVNNNDGRFGDDNGDGDGRFPTRRGKYWRTRTC